MKIEKRQLIDGLDSIRKFIGKKALSPIWLTVLIDGKTQKIIAQNSDGRAEIQVDMRNAYKQLNVPHEPQFPDEKFFVDLLELDQDQLLSLCYDYGIPHLPNPSPMEMIQQIWKHALINADEEGNTRREWVHEKFCINPLKLRKIVQSLELRDKDFVNLEVEIEVNNNKVIDDEQFIPYILRVGDHFQSIPVYPESDFPSPLYIDTPLSFVKVADFTGKELQHLCNSSLDLGDLPYQEIILFDTDKDTAVAYDDKRVHAITKPMNSLGKIKAQTHIVRNVSRNRKIEMLFDPQASVVKFVSGNLSVTTTHVNQNFPGYEKQLGMVFQHSVTTDAKSLEKFVKQAQNLTGLHYRAVDLEFKDGNIALSISNPSAGQYLNEDIDLINGTVPQPEKFRVDAKFVEQALFPKSGVHSWVDISFDSGGKIIKFHQGDCISLVVTMK